MANECKGCPHEGHGSEHCAASWGDYCPLTGEYILMTPQDEAEYFRIWGDLPPREFVKGGKNNER